MAEYFKVEEMVRRNAPIISEYGDASSMESVLLGGLSGERQWMDLAANPESYVDRNCPPFLFLSGTKDQVVSIVQTMHFAAKIMHEAGMNKVRFQTVEGAHHNIHDFEKEWIYDLEAEFLRDVMKERRSIRERICENEQHNDYCYLFYQPVYTPVRYH